MQLFGRDNWWIPRWVDPPAAPFDVEPAAEK